MNEVFFLNGSWNYNSRKVNFKTFAITYERKGGFDEKTAAERQMQADETVYEQDIAKLKNMTNIKYTFMEYLIYWMKNVFLQSNSSAKPIGVWAIQNIIIPKITQDVILSYVTADYLNELQKKCETVSESAGETVNKFLRKVIRFAFSEGYISSLTVLDKLEPAKRKAPEVQLLNHEQLQAFVSETVKHPGYSFEIIAGLFMGLRKGETLGLRVEDFDREKGTVRIRRQMTTNYHLAESSSGCYRYSTELKMKEPKAESSRILKVPPFIFDALDERLAYNEVIFENYERRTGEKSPDMDFICVSAYGRLKKGGTLLSTVKNICKNANVPSISYHALRHIFATLLLEQGCPLEHVSKLLGHTSVMTTFNIYAGVVDDSEARTAIEGLIPGMVI